MRYFSSSRQIQNPVSKEVTIQVRLAVPLYESPDSKESGLFCIYALRINYE